MRLRNGVQQTERTVDTDQVGVDKNYNGIGFLFRIQIVLTKILESHQPFVFYYHTEWLVLNTIPETHKSQLGL